MLMQAEGSLDRSLAEEAEWPEVQAKSLWALNLVKT